MHPSGARRSCQSEIAIRNDRVDYVDFVIAHGVDIDAGGNDLFTMVMSCATDDATTLQRIYFLVGHGARAAGSRALREVVVGDNMELASCLLDSGVEVVDGMEPEKTSSLMGAAREGYQDMGQLLLDRGADAELVDLEGRDAVAIAKGATMTAL